MSGLEAILGRKPHPSILLVLSLVGLAITHRLFSSIYSAFFGPLSKIPGPKLRAFTELPELIDLIRGTDVVNKAALHAKYGPVVRVSPNKVIFASGAQAYKDIYGFKKHSELSNKKNPKFYTTPYNGVHSIITAPDETHSRFRKILSHSFADKTLKEVEPMLKFWTGKLQERLHESAVAGQSIDMVKLYNSATFDVMADLTFGESLGMLDNGEYTPWVKSIFDGVRSSRTLFVIMEYNVVAKWFIRRFLLQSKRVREGSHRHWSYTTERVDRRIAKKTERLDLWTRVLEKAQNGEMSLEEQYSNASIFMLAGTETTATALSGALYRLCNNPETYAKLAKEIRDAFTSLEDVTVDALQHLKYLHAVCQEALRTYPPVPTAMERVTPQGGAVIDGIALPEGVSIGCHNLATFRNPDLFKNPDEFRPERWLGDPEYKDDHLNAVEPFSVGPRNCIGKNLAYHEMRLLLVATFLNHDMELLPEATGWMDQRAWTIWEKKPLMARATVLKK
jgi:cytochrome P450